MNAAGVSRPNAFASGATNFSAAVGSDHRADHAGDKADDPGAGGRADRRADRAPPTMRAPNCIGTFRLGVEGSWSVTNSTIASSVKIQGVQE